MSLPTTYSTASARAAGPTRAQLRGPRFVRLAHALFVRLDDAIDEVERLAVLSSVLPPRSATAPRPPSSAHTPTRPGDRTSR